MAHTLTFSGATAFVDGVSVTSPYTLTKSCTLKFVSSDNNYGLNVNGNAVYEGTETFDLADVDIIVTRQAPSMGMGATVYVNYTESGGSAITYKHFFKGAKIGTGNIIFRDFAPVPTLATPQNVSIDGTMLSWDEVENATSYDIYADGALIGNTDGGSE